MAMARYHKWCGIILKALMLLVVAIVFCSSHTIYAQGPGPLLRVDNVPWKFSNVPERIIVVGDIHGDLSILHQILRDRNLVNDRGHWVGGKSHLVMLGDFNGRGVDTAFVLEYLFRLSQEAKGAGGMLHSLLGNHDFFPLTGDFEKYSIPEARLFRGYAQKHRFDELPFRLESFSALTSQFLSLNAAQRLEQNAVLSDQLDFWAALSHRYRSWMLERNAYVQIGPYLFSHAGPRPWSAGNPQILAQINATMRQWIRFLTRPSTEVMPPSATDWVVSRSSDLWSRRLAQGQVPEDQLDDILETFHAEHFFIGHDVTHVSHAIYGEKVYLMDSGNSYVFASKGTKPSSAEIKYGLVTLFDHRRPLPGGAVDLAIKLGLTGALRIPKPPECQIILSSGM